MRAYISMDFTAIDVETANADLSSICQIGVVRFVGGQVAESWQTLIDPIDYFDSINVSIHGITESSIAGAPKFEAICELLAARLSGKVTISHSAFDRVAISAVFKKHQIAAPQSRWLDTTKVVRCSWPQFAQRGYGLANIAGMLGIAFQHHDAAEDARAAGEIFIHAMKATGLSVEEWLERVNQPIAGGTSSTEIITRNGNPEGLLQGEVLVFTGALAMPRRVAADLAAKAGCDVASNVTAATSILVVGDQDVARLAGHEKSSKHRKAEKMITMGKPIRILRESDFLLLIHGT